MKYEAVVYCSAIHDRLMSILMIYAHISDLVYMLINATKYEIWGSCVLLSNTRLPHVYTYDICSYIRLGSHVLLSNTRPPHVLWGGHVLLSNTRPPHISYMQQSIRYEAVMYCSAIHDRASYLYLLKICWVVFWFRVPFDLRQKQVL